MKSISPAYAERLHESGPHPYSQYVQVNGTDVCWVVNTLTEEAYHEIVVPLLDQSFQKVELYSHKDQLNIKNKEVTAENSYNHLVEQYYFGDGNPVIRLRFLTPTSFKSENQYCIFPTTKLIFQSLMLKYDAFSDSSTIYSEDLLDQFQRYALISGYRLRSTTFYLAGARIPSFIGDVTLRIHGTRQLANIARMLVGFGEFSGIGIKTGMGMGAVKVLGGSEIMAERRGK
ncbi:MAG: CRISPR-associated endoribonuclease Cas6 [Bilifractor sp.]